VDEGLNADTLAERASATTRESWRAMVLLKTTRDLAEGGFGGSRRTFLRLTPTV
jgi:hypothetical protein